MDNKITIKFINEKKDVEIDIQQPDLSTLVKKIIAEHLTVSKENLTIDTEEENFDKEEFLELLIEVHEEFCKEIDAFYENIKKDISTYYKDAELSEYVINKIKEVH